MFRPSRISKAAVVAFLLSLSASSYASAGEITRPHAASDFTWQSTECVRPVRPFIRRGDPARQLIMQDFAANVARYIECLKEEAQRDFDRAQVEMQDAVQRTLQEEVDQMNDQMDAVVRESR